MFAVTTVVRQPNEAFRIGRRTEPHPPELVGGRLRAGQRQPPGYPLAFPENVGDPNKDIGASTEGVLNGLLIPRPRIGDRTQPPLLQKSLHLLELCEIMCRIESPIVLRPELSTMRRRQRIEDRRRILAGILWPDRLQRLGGHARNLHGPTAAL